LAAIVLIGALRPAQAADPLLLNRPDLHAHTWLSFSLALTLTEVLEGPDPAWGPGLGTLWATVIASGAVGLLGVAKELSDDPGSGADLVADATGLLLNGLVQVTLRF
jgi:hypothetical protein